MHKATTPPSLLNYNDAAAAVPLLLEGEVGGIAHDTVDKVEHLFEKIEDVDKELAGIALRQWIVQCIAVAV